MNIDDSRLIVRFQRLITEMLVEKRLGQRRPELTDELYQTWREVEQGGLKETPEYRDVLVEGRSARFVACRIGEARCAGYLFTRNRAPGHVGCRTKSRLVKPVSAHPRNYKHSLINRWPSLRFVAATYSSSRSPLVSKG